MYIAEFVDIRIVRFQSANSNFHHTYHSKQQLCSWWTARSQKENGISVGKPWLRSPVSGRVSVTTYPPTQLFLVSKGYVFTNSNRSKILKLFLISIEKTKLSLGQLSCTFSVSFGSNCKKFTFLLGSRWPYISYMVKIYWNRTIFIS